MRTLFVRIAVTLVLTFLLSVVAVFWISGYITRRVMGEFIEGSLTLELRQAERTYKTGGPQALAQYLSETDEALKGTRYLTDANGRDLVSGLDRSALRPTGFGFLGFPKQNHGQLVIVRTSDDGLFRLVVIAPPPLSLIRFLPFFLLVAALIAVLGWVLSVGIVSPLHRVAHAVERFGRGDLSARVNSRRKDEIGNLARSFDSMAERIETLLTAERRLLQDVSHELRSPLARLSFAAELMKESSDRDAATDRMRREINRLTGLVATLIEMTSAEGDPSSRRTQRVKMRELVQEVLHDCEFEAQARKIRITAELSSSAAVEGDAELLRRAVENVLRNAIRYTLAGQSVSIRLADQKGTVSVAIRDYGPGVPEDQLERIFDPFFRVSESRDSSNGGVGLGLSIARRAILLHHGTIRAENASPGLQVQLTIPHVPV
jgi:two-component system sensor histidine kinase CpxA